jgi:iron complex transport system substrate-binding protein
MLAAAAMRPALVVTMGSAGRDQTRLAAAVGARLLVLPYPASLADISASVRSVGQATGNVRRAEGLVATMRSAAANAPGGAVDTMWLDGAGRTLSPSSLGAAWLRLAGLKQRSVAGDQVTLEAMLTRPPAVVVQSRYRAGQMSSATGWLRHPAAQRLARARTLFTDGRRWTCAGPTLLPEIFRLRQALAR